MARYAQAPRLRACRSCKTQLDLDKYASLYTHKRMVNGTEESSYSTIWTPCPNCGDPEWGKLSGKTWAIVGIIGFIIFVILFLIGPMHVGWSS